MPAQGLPHPRHEKGFPAQIQKIKREYFSGLYGYRKDPFEKCTKFHEGIDLRAGHEVAYSMLPGKVALRKYGNTGYPCAGYS